MQTVLSFLQKHRRVLQGALLVFALFFVFSAVWLTHIRGQGDKSSSWAINDQFHEFVLVEQQLEQTFACDRDLLALSLVLAAQDPALPPQGEVELVLADADTGQQLARSVGDMRYILNGWEAYYTTLGLDRFVENPGRAVTYRLTLTPHYTGEGRLCVGYEPGGMPAGVALSADGQALDGTVALLGTQARVGGFLTTFYWVIAFGCMAAAALCFWLMTSQKAPLHRLVFCGVLLLGFLFNLVLPPYAAPDEKYHINQSFTLASTIYNPYLPVAKSHINDTLRRPSDQDALLQVDETTVFTWQHIARVIGRPNTDPTGHTNSFEENQVDSQYTMYWVSALGVLAGFWLHLSFAATLYLGRFANLLLFAFCSAWAVKKTPVAKPVFAAAALLPMTLHLAASYSRDSNLMAMTFLFIALLLDLAFGPKEQLCWKQLVLPGLLAIWFAPSKVVYFPLVLLIFLIPAARLGRYSKWIKAGFVALCLLAFMGSNGVLLSFSGFTQGNGAVAAGAASSQAAEEQAPAAGQAEQAGSAVSEGDPGAAAEPRAELAAPPAQDSVCFSLPYILSHPLETAELCIRSVVQQGDHYLRTLVGGTLGYFNLQKDLDLAWGWVILLYGLLALAWLCPGGRPLPAFGRWLCLLVGLCCCGLAVLGCISWTPTYYTSIYGFQGRYFLPVLPLLLLWRPKALALAADCRRGLTFAFILTDIGVLLNAFLAVVAR